MAAAVLGWLLIDAWKRRQSATGRAFLALIGCAQVWNLGFIVEMTAAALGVKVAAAQVQYTAIGLLPPAWVWLVLAFLGRTWPRGAWRLLLLAPTSTLLVVWTNAWHGWFWDAARLVASATGAPRLDLDYQFWFYYVHLPASYLSLLLALGVLVRALPRLQPVYRAQGWLLLAAMLLPTLTNLLYILQAAPVPSLSLTTTVFSLSGVILAWALFRYRFLDLLPLARDVVIDNLQDGMIVLDLKHRLLDLNPAARQMTGLSATAVGRSLPELENDFARRIDRLCRDDVSQADVALGQPDEQHYDLRLSPVRDRRGALVGRVVTLRDISERVRLVRQLETLALQDSLTGLANRRGFLEACRREVYRLRRHPHESLAVLMIDLDHFKAINDRHGHAAGDQALRDFARSVRGQLKAGDSVGRVGGEEFAVLLPDTSLAQALQVAERLRASVAGRRPGPGAPEIRLTASFGAASSEQLAPGAATADGLLALADQALYQAKQAGRNRVATSQGPLGLP